MPPARSFRFAVLAAALIGLAVPSGAGASTHQSLQQTYLAAAREFHVPPAVLLAVAYQESRWDAHAGEPSFSGGYGPLHLTDSTATLGASGKQAFSPRVSLDPALHTVDAAASLTGTALNQLRGNTTQNIRGGAALLASYERAAVGGLPADPAAWYPAVARYSQATDEATAAGFADRVYARIRSGASRVTDLGQRVTLRGQTIRPDRASIRSLHLARVRASATGVPDCPPADTCNYVPAAYAQNSTAPGDYGNYDLSLRPGNGLDIRYIVIHDTEESYDDTLAGFQNPEAFVSSHYVIRSSDGLVTQMVPNQDVAWHAGNWYVNSHSIGIEHEGFARDASWFTEDLYESSAALVKHLTREFGIPRDRMHIIGHDNVPGIGATATPAMHWDPGTFWDWQHYMALLGQKFGHRDRANGVITITPDWATNVQQTTTCDDQVPCSNRVLPAQPTNFVYLRTAPDPEAPLITDTVMGPGTTNVEDWADKAVYGQRFVLAQRQGDWAGIWFAGQLAWLYDPNGQNTTAAEAMVVTPKAGQASIATYGVGYPNAEDYPPGIEVRNFTPLEYTIPAGERYVATGPYHADFFSAPTYTLDPNDHTVVTGPEQFYEISLGHRIAFVRAEDVDLVQ